MSGMIPHSDIEQYFYIKLLDAKGGANGGLLTVMELILFLNELFKITLKYCDRLEQSLKLALEFPAGPNYQPRLIELQGDCINGLINTLNLFREVVGKAITAGFGLQVNAFTLYRAVAQTMLKILLVSHIVETTLGPFEDDVPDVKRILDSKLHLDTYLLRRVEENAPATRMYCTTP